MINFKYAVVPDDPYSPVNCATLDQVRNNFRWERRVHNANCLVRLESAWTRDPEDLNFDLTDALEQYDFIKTLKTAGFRILAERKGHVMEIVKEHE